MILGGTTITVLVRRMTSNGGPNIKQCISLSSQKEEGIDTVHQSREIGGYLRLERLRQLLCERSGLSAVFVLEFHKYLTLRLLF